MKVKKKFVFLIIYLAAYFDTSIGVIVRFILFRILSF